MKGRKEANAKYQIAIAKVSNERKFLQKHSINAKEFKPRNLATLLVNNSQRQGFMF